MSRVIQCLFKKRSIISKRRIFHRVQSVFSRPMTSRTFPDKQAPEFKRYIAWSTVSTFLSSTESILGAHSMLSVAGKDSTEMAITLNYIGKDVLGQLGGLVYMYRMGKKADQSPEKFANKSLFIQQLSIVVECATPLIDPTFFLPIAGGANLCKNISSTGLGAINAKMIQRLNTNDNVGELYAKISTANTLASTLGMGLGLFLSYAVPDHTERLLLIPLITIPRVYTYKKAIQSLVATK